MSGMETAEDLDPATKKELMAEVKARGNDRPKENVRCCPMGIVPATR